MQNKPLNMGCAPPANRLPASIDNPCAYLGPLRAALYALMSGSQTQEVRFGDQWQRFHPGNVGQLRAEVRKLERQCDPQYARGSAVRAGPYVPVGARRFASGWNAFGYGPSRSW